MLSLNYSSWCVCVCVCANGVVGGHFMEQRALVSARVDRVPQKQALLNQESNGPSRGSFVDWLGGRGGGAYMHACICMEVYGSLKEGERQHCSGHLK